MTGTLTDRYVAAALHHLPARQRPEIEKELRASIADTLDGRLDAGDDPADAEVAALTQLGDPARLAAGYADRPLQLIGPALYLDYRRLLTALLVTIVPAVAVAVGLTRGLAGAGAADVLGGTLGAAVTTAVHIGFWTTLGFAVIERLAVRGPLRRSWTPDALPAEPSRRLRYAELISVTVVTVLFSAGLLLSPSFSTETDAAGAPIGLFAPWLWETGVVYWFVAVVAVELCFVYARYYARWSVPLAVAGALADFAAPVTLIWLVLNDKVLNPAFVAAAGWPPEVPYFIGVGLVVMSVLTILHTVAESLRRARNR
ncbi:permease prefix domain 1-containing protein [Spongiactinospora sp. TRM90649]|uniref:permease prefix domain 1-containing protein n=1 Tax=Spongiactinospora sp. TRM90649 TaxID=3031114 RepID=UPI0023F70A01|nr:permease prefix domain 1-containing protein [Spongiactinospora sp. TRM90649]MDF5756416.1 permease prefix domain 1-containing protein [Spongiactinospora sp. TRM90649]